MKMSEFRELTRVQAADRALVEAQKVYLVKRGWKYFCGSDNSDSLAHARALKWYWRWEHPSGFVMLKASEAVNLQMVLDRLDVEMNGVQGDAGHSMGAEDDSSPD